MQSPSHQDREKTAQSIGNPVLSLPRAGATPDHKPLEPIINGLNGKSLADIENPRLQRLLQKVAAYTFEVQHIDGVRNKIADALS